MRKLACIFLLLTFFLLVNVIVNVSQVQAQDLRYPAVRFAAWNHQTTGIGSTTLDGANDWIEEVFYAFEAGTLSSICTNFVSETGTGPVLKLGWEGVSLSTGEADGVYKTGTGECSCTINTNGETAGWKCCTPTGTTCTVARGELGALTTKVSSGADVSNFAVVGQTASGEFNDDQALIPNDVYAVTNVTGNSPAGSGTKSNEAPIYMYKFAGRTFGRPFTTASTQNYSSDSASDEYGNKFRYDCPAGQTYKVAGIEWYGQTASAAKSAIVRLYTGSAAVPGTAAQDVTWDADIEQSSAGSNRGFAIPFNEASLTALNCGSDYFVTIQVQETSSNFGLRYFDVGANSDLDAYPGGINTYAVNRADSTGAFTEVNTRRMDISILLDDIQDASGGGGGSGGGSVSIMTRDITQSEATAAERRIPLYLVDATDGVTEETGVSISGTECRVSKNGAASATCAGSVAENETGLYYYEPTQAEVNTVGYVTVRIADSAARKFLGVANVNAFDFTTALQTVNVASVDTGAIEEGDFAARGTAVAVGPGSITLAASETFGDNALRNNAVHIVSATTGAGQTECICSNIGSTDVATLCANWNITPTGTVTYNLQARPACDRVVASVTGNVGGTINGLTAVALKDFFDTDSAALYAGAVAGSVVKEIADNAATGGGGGDFMITTGTAQSVTASPPKMRLAAAAPYGNDVLKDNAAVLILTSSGTPTAVGQVICIKSNASSNDEVTLIKPYKILPSGTVTYAVIPAPNCNPAVWPKDL